MSRLTSPLGLAAHVRRPDTGLDAAAIASVLLVALAVAEIIGSRFLYAPGVTIALNDGVPAELNVPVSSGPGRLAGVRTADTVTIVALKQADMAVWNGRIRTLAQLEKELSASPHAPGSALLIKADRSVSMQSLYDIISVARRAKFESIQLAGEDSPAK